MKKLSNQNTRSLFPVAFPPFLSAYLKQLLFFIFPMVGGLWFAYFRGGYELADTYNQFSLPLVRPGENILQIGYVRSEPPSSNKNTNYLATVLNFPDQLVGQTLNAVLQFTFEAVIATGIVFIIFYLSLVITLQAPDLLRTARTTTYSCSIYLINLLGLLYFITPPSGGLRPGASLLIALQAEVLSWLIEHYFPMLYITERTSEISFGGEKGKMAILLLSVALLGINFFYSLYIGARVNHNASKFSATIASISVAFGPVIYIGILLIIL